MVTAGGVAEDGSSDILNDPTATEENARDEAAGEIVKDVLALIVEDW